MRAYIYVGGAICADRITERPGEEDLRIAADSGYANAVALGVVPSVVLGDFDSLDKNTLPKGIEIHTVPAEKDFTDTQMAVDFALSRGCNDLVIIGGLSGRLDHTLSNLAILEEMHARRVHAVIADGCNRVRFLRNGSILVARSAYRYLSILAADPVVKGVDAEGLKYPLKNAKLSRLNQYAVSNEITRNCALISVKKGGIFLVESADA